MRKCPELWHSLDFAHPSQLPLPFALHGDSAPFLEHDSVHVLSMRCLLTKKSVAESQLLLTCMPKLAAVKETWEKIMECLSWSFTVLYNGRTPKKGFGGQAADGPRGKPMRRCVLWAITGPLLEVWSFLHQNSTGSTEMRMRFALVAVQIKSKNLRGPLLTCDPLQHGEAQF